MKVDRKILEGSRVTPPRTLAKSRSHLFGGTGNAFGTTSTNQHSTILALELQETPLSPAPTTHQALGFAKMMPVCSLPSDVEMKETHFDTHRDV